MKLIKVLGLTAIGAIVATTLVNASSAFATNTALCTTHAALACPAGDKYTGHIEGLAIKPELLSNLADVVCDHSVILGNALGLGSAPDGKSQLTHLELIDFTGNCKTLLGVPCTVTTITIGLVDLLKTGFNSGVVTSLGSKVKVVCGFVLNCTFGGEPQGQAVGSSLPLNTESLGTITVGKAPLTGEGPLCPEQGKWDAKYTIQLPHQVFITE
jgi:hypothetical protein